MSEHSSEVLQPKPSSVSPGGETEGSTTVAASKPQRRQRGLLSRIWHGIFSGRRGDDFEKLLQHLSKEEATVLARMKGRAQLWRRTARNIVVLSVVLEVVAVAYAIMTTRTVDLDWKMRAVRVLPMFVLPCLSAAIYSTLVSFTRMRDRKDQKTLERLRAERQAKIDELKERTNYYTTQQLIQRYDPDPAAKAAAASVLASKLGADSGLKVYLGDDSNKLNMPVGKSNDAELVQSHGLRNRKPSHARSRSHGDATMPQQSFDGSMQELEPRGQDVHDPNQAVFEHHRSPGANDGGWIARLAAMLVGEDPTQCYALICGNCRMHNGLARKEDFPYITYYCPHCHALIGPQQMQDQPDLGLNVGGSNPTSLENKVSDGDVSPETDAQVIDRKKDIVGDASDTTNTQVGTGENESANASAK
ncbi:Uncharacterized protein QJS10_CPA16g01516 [Acorus calamus]|uniref:Lunapark zinc ribbon domain-containing protein n=1 Tax=Acorus calamus TaxID=4465 RepID=A0AAV9D1G8_ACOCL|nr:Uncharacterized protein QJS10_CPA16g01516 [Acorus calamus]